MNAATASEIARFETMTITNVVEKFESLFGEKCLSRNEGYWIRRIARRLQANADYVPDVWESLEPRYRDFGVEVPSVTFEQVCAQAADFGIDEVDLIKLDCEGSEYLIVSELPALYVLPVSKCQ
jgi:FkbM family methyltransferase